MPRSLIIFAKNAEFGKVKTRLAATLGKNKAFEIYEQLVKYTCRVVSGVFIQKTVYYSSFIEKGGIWSTEFFKKTQSTGSLGDRMSSAFKDQFESNDRVVIIGSDCAELTSKIITTAFETLEDHDFVLGPANDGGYYLLGMRLFHPSIFEHITWSTEHVLRDTIKKIDAASKSYFLLPELIDVDDENDWNQVKENFE